MNSWIPVFFLLGSTLIHAQDEDSLVGGRSRAWYSQLTGNMNTKDIEISSEISLEGDLGFGGQELLPDLSVWVHTPFLPVLDRINFGYWFGSFEESEILERTINFGNQEFEVGTTLESNLDFSLLTVSFEHFFLSSGNRDLGCTMGAVLGVKYIEAEALLENKDFGWREKQTLAAPFPVIGFHFLVYMTKQVTVEMEMVGSGGRYGDLGGSYFEWFLEATYRPLDWVFVGLGYKAAMFGMENKSGDEFEAKMRLKGLFFSVGIQF